MRYFVVITAFNEAPRIGPLLKKVKKFTKRIIVVDDGSLDKTGEVAQREAVKVLRHRVNLGKGAAIKTGVEMAFSKKAEAVVLLDADGQHNPLHIPEFVGELRRGYDIVFGTRIGAEAPFVRFIGNRLGSFLISLLFGIYRRDMLCGFIAFTRSAYEKIKWESTGYGVETEIVARTGKNKLKYGEIPIETIYKDKYKGVTILDAIGVLLNIPKWLIS